MRLAASRRELQYASCSSACSVACSAGEELLYLLTTHQRSSLMTG
eukprot:COSAG01_NODE_12082_length_1803_cov_42.661972_1_plen_45_part_00